MNINIIIATAFFLFFLSQGAMATGIIKGTVTDKEKNIPLIGASVIIADSKIGTATDNEGEFVIKNITPGKYQLIISMMGFKSRIIDIKISDNEILELNVSLHTAILQLSNITITGQAKRNLLETPQIESVGLELSTSIVTQQEIQRQGAKTVIDALNFVPGALIETRGRKVKQFFSVRGQTYPYPEYSINGVWQREFFEMSYVFPSFDIEKIEVIRSSAALLTGINGMAGVVNIIPREYNSPETSFMLEYGTFNTYQANISHGAKINNVSYSAAISINHTNGPDSMHAKENMASINTSIKWTPNKKFTLNYYLFHNEGDRELRLAEPPASKRFLTELGSYDPIRSTLSNLKIDYKFSKNSSTEFLIYYTERNPIYIDEDDSTHQITRFDENDWEWGFNLTHSQRLSLKNTLRFGGLYNHWTAPNGKRFYYGKRNDLETISFVAVDEHDFGALKLDAGLRWSQTFINEYGGFGIDGSGKGFANVEPIIDTWQEPIIQSNIGGSYSFANLFLLNFNTTAGQIKPLPGSLDTNFIEPKNETRIKLDLGIQKIWVSLGQLSITGFYVQQKDAIVLSGKTYDSPERYMELYLNRDQNQYGLEAEAKSTKLWNTLEIFLNTTIMNAFAEQEGTMKTNNELPQIISSGGIYYQKSHLNLSILSKYVSNFESTRFAAPGLPPQPLGDYTTIDASMAWNLYGKNFSTRFYLEIKNITNKHYSTVVGYPDFGRTFTIGIKQTIK